MCKLTLTGLALPLFLLFASPPASAPRTFGAMKETTESQVHGGTLQKMIVESGTVTMDLDLSQLNGVGSAPGRPTTLQFAVAANSFFPILVFNNLLRGPEPGSMALIPAMVNASGYSLPAALRASLTQFVIERLPSGGGFDFAVRDGKTGFVFFNVEGCQYGYDANAKLLSITGGRLLVSKELAKSLGRASQFGAVAGRISIGGTMQAVEVTQLDAKGDVRTAKLPALQVPLPGTVPGPDVIIGELISLEQLGSGAVNGNVGLALGTDACNKGTIDVDWFALPNNDHPFIPQNLYRMRGGATHNERFEQIGQSWGKHAFTAASSNTCNFGCNGVSGTHLGSGCSDAYDAGLNGSQTGIGSRAWVNPFTGFFVGSTANNHSGHSHDVTSHRILVDTDDLIPAENQNATYFAEAEYIVPHEYTWCQSHPGECNMYNNASYRQQTVSGGPTNFTFGPVGPTVREQPAIMAWTGATVNRQEPDPGNDGIWFMGFRVTNPSTGVWHYEYALYNQNLDRSIQSFTVPLGPGVNVSNIGFHAPIQHPGWANDGTQGNAGYSSTPWTVTQNTSSVTWNTETFAQNQNANAIRFGTLYNFRFDADQPPNLTDGTVGFFKTGAPMPVLIEAPGNVPTPSPTPTPTATPSPIPTPTACAGLNIIQVGGSIVPGSNDIGNHGDDVVTSVALPFSFTACGVAHNSVNVSSNGNAQFNTNDIDDSVNVCVPWPAHDCTIFPYWDDLRTDTQPGCLNYPGGTCGIYTSVTGTAPNRIFNIEWRAVYFATPSDTANFELSLYEGQNRFDVIYGPTVNGNTTATAGMQNSDTCFAQYFCNGSGGPATGGWIFGLAGTPSPTPTATITPTASPSGTATVTATATPTASPSATPTPTCSICLSPSPTPTPTANATPTATAIPTATSTGTPAHTPSPTSTSRPTATPRSSPAPRIRPTPPPRP